MWKQVVNLVELTFAREDNMTDVRTRKMFVNLLEDWEDVGKSDVESLLDMDIGWYDCGFRSA